MIRSGNPSRELITMYEDRMASGDIQTPLFWINKGIGWVINLDKLGEIRSVDPLSNDKGGKERFVLPEILTSRSSGLSPLLTHDTLKYFSDAAAWKAWKGKHLAFDQQIEFPKSFIAFLNDNPSPPLEIGSSLWETLRAVTRQGLKKTASANNAVLDKLLLSSFFVVRMPDGTYLHDHAGVKTFWNALNILEWQNQGKSKKDQDHTKKGYSSITGKWCDLSPFHVAIGSCVPGAQSGAKIGSINGNAASYHSYGQEGAFCVPMTVEETFKLKSAIQDLALNNGTECVRMVSGATRKFVVWKNRLMEDKTLIVAWGPECAVSLFDLGSESDEDKSGKKTLSGVAKEMMQFLSNKGGGELPEVMEGDCVHLLSLSAKSGGRIAIEDYWYEDAPGFAKRMAEWYDCTMLLSNGQPTYSGLWNVVAALNFPEKVAGYHTYRQLQNAIFNGNALPSSIKQRAKQQMLSLLTSGKNDKRKSGGFWFDGYKSPFRLFRACKMREGTVYQKGGFDMEIKSAAYHLGVLLVEMDDAKQKFDSEKHGRKYLGMDLTPTAIDLLRGCINNPIRGLRYIREKLQTFNGWGLAETADGRFDGLQDHFNEKQTDCFWAGVSAGLAARKSRMVNGAANKARRELEKAHDAGKF